MTAALLLLLAAPPALPEPTALPPYVPALTVLDDVLRLPPGEPPVVQPDAVCYRPAAHLRLVLALKLAEGLSHERARAAWLYGWRDASAASAQAFDAEHVARLEAEAEADTARFWASQADWPWWRAAGVGLGLAGLGAIVGFVAGATL